jgi:hypothetical protein
MPTQTECVERRHFRKTFFFRITVSLKVRRKPTFPVPFPITVSLKGFRTVGKKTGHLNRLKDTILLKDTI